jgi:uncharacterized alpha-E superfamily protein
MLSRIAESFFWIGRYLERAEATARLLAEHHHLLIEDRSVSEDIGAVALLDALSISAPSVADAGGLVSAVIGAPNDPSTVRGSVAAARENARAVRDQLSVDVFEALNSAHISLSRGLLFAASPGVGLHRVVERLLVAHGVIEWTMSRDEGYLFLSLGRRLERMDMTTRLLAVRHEQLWPDGGPVATLRAAGGLNGFLRTKHTLTGTPVRQFLVLDEHFPRSLLMSARGAEDAVRGLADHGAHDSGQLLRECGMIRSRLEYVVEPDSDTVDALILDAQLAAAKASEAAALNFFNQAGTIVWSH